MLLFIAYVIGFIIWGIFTWGLLWATIEAIHKKYIWNIVYCGIGFLSALFMLIAGILKNLHIIDL